MKQKHAAPAKENRVTPFAGGPVRTSQSAPGAALAAIGRGNVKLYSSLSRAGPDRTAPLKYSALAQVPMELRAHRSLRSAPLCPDQVPDGTVFNMVRPDTGNDGRALHRRDVDAAGIHSCRDHTCLA